VPVILVRPSSIAISVPSRATSTPDNVIELD
jgi:hypothetical protein